MSSYKYFSSFFFIFFIHFCAMDWLYLTAEHFLDCTEVLVNVLRLDVRNVLLFIVVAYCCCLLLLFIVVVYCLLYVNTHEKARTFCLIVRLCLSCSHQFQDQNNTSLVNAADALILGGGDLKFQTKIVWRGGEGG